MELRARREARALWRLHRCPPKDGSYRTIDTPDWLASLVLEHMGADATSSMRSSSPAAPGLAGRCSGPPAARREQSDQQDRLPEFSRGDRQKRSGPGSVVGDQPWPGLSLSGWRDLNPRPLRPERSALPSCATPRGVPSNRSPRLASRSRGYAGSPEVSGARASGVTPRASRRTGSVRLGECPSRPIRAARTTRTATGATPWPCAGPGHSW